MTRRPTILDSLAAIALLAALVAVVVFAVVMPVRDSINGFDRTFAEDMRMIERLSAGSSSIDKYREAISVLEAQIAEDDRYIKADSDALAFAALQQLVQAVIADNGGTMRSIQNVEVDPKGHERPVSVRVIASATYPVLIELLAELESNRPYLFVDGLSIKAPATGRAVTDWAPLSVQFEVVAFLSPVVQ